MLETNINKSSLDAAVNFESSNLPTTKLTWAGLFGFMRIMTFLFCNASGQIVKGVILGIRVALRASSKCSRCFSSLPKGETQGPSTAQNDSLRSSSYFARDDNVWVEHFTEWSYLSAMCEHEIHSLVAEDQHPCATSSGRQLQWLCSCRFPSLFLACRILV